MDVNMRGKVVVITGATSGLGLESARSLGAMGAELALVARNRDKGEAVLAELKGTGVNARLFLADLSSQKEIRRVGAELKGAYPRIDVLLNNAGAILQERQLTVDGLEATFATNHLAYFLLTHLLLDNLKAAPSARVVCVASEAERAGKIHLDDLNLEKGFSAFKAYSQSKLANILFAYELSRRLQGSRVTANAMHPGAVATGFAKEYTGVVGFIFRLGRPFMRSPAKGAETAIWLASAREVEGMSGRYFQDKKEIKSIPASYDLELAKKLWEVSLKLTGLE